MPSSPTACSTDPAGLHPQPEDRGRVVPVHGVPAVLPVADVAGHALVTGDLDQHGDEAVVALTVHGRGQPHHQGAYAAIGQRQRGRRVRHARVHGRRLVELGADPARREPEGPGRDRHGLAGALQRGAHRLDGGQVGPGGVLHLAEVVDVGEVDDPVGLLGTCAQAVEIAEVAAMHLRSRPDQRLGRGVGASQSDHRVAGPLQLGHDGGTDETGCSGDEQTHVRTSWMDDGTDVSHCHGQ